MIIWLVKHIPKSMKMSESDYKQKDMNLFEPKIDNDMSVDYKPKKIDVGFKGKFLEWIINEQMPWKN